MTSVTVCKQNVQIHCRIQTYQCITQHTAMTQQNALSLTDYETCFSCRFQLNALWSTMKPVFPPQRTTYSDIIYWDFANNWWSFELWINLPTWCNIYCIISARHVSGLYAHLQEQVDVIISYIYSIWCPWRSRCQSWGECVLMVCCTATHHQHTLSSRLTPTTPRTPYAVYVRNYNIYFSWRWAYKPETCRADIIQ